MLRRIAHHVPSLFTVITVLVPLACVLGFVVALPSRDVAIQTATVNHLVKFNSTTGTVGDSFVVDNGASGLDAATHQIHNVTDPSSAQDAATQAYVLAHAGGGSSIGGAVTGGTNKSILFISPAATLAQDNASFQYDNVLKALKLGTDAVTKGYGYPVTMTSALAGDVVYALWNTDATGYAGGNYFKSDGATYAAGFGYGNASAVLSGVRNAFFTVVNAGVDIVDVDVATGRVEHKRFQTAGQAAYQLADGASAPNGASATGKLIYNAGATCPGLNAGCMQVSANGGNFANVVTDGGPGITSINTTGCGTSVPSNTGSSRKGRQVQGTGATQCGLVFPYNPTSCNVTCEAAYCSYSISGNTVTVIAALGNAIDYDCN
jgi:hypothetical protein